MQASIALGALLSAFLVFTFMPETAIPGTRGCDRAAAERVKLGLSPEEKKWGIVWVNPYKSVRLLRSPNLMAVVRHSLNMFRGLGVDAKGDEGRQ